jgi:Mor family transcriptional regulator
MLDPQTARSEAGTHQASNRGLRGEENGNAKLSAGHVAEMRTTYAAGGVTHAELGLRYGVSEATARFVVIGKTWKEAPGPTLTRRGPRRGEEHHQAKLSDADAAEMRTVYAAGGVSVSELALRYGVSTAVIRRMIRGKSWKHVGGPTGPVRGLAKLSSGEVAEIRRDFAAGASAADLGRRYGVAETTVYHAVRGNTYKNSGGPAWTRRGCAKLSAGDAAEIRSSHAAGASAGELARRYRVSRTAIASVLQGKTWRPKGSDAAEVGRVNQAAVAPRRSAPVVTIGDAGETDLNLDRPSFRGQHNGDVPNPARVRAPAAPAGAGHEPVAIGNSPDVPPIVLGKEKPLLRPKQHRVIKALDEARPGGLSEIALIERSGCGGARGILKALSEADADWRAVIRFPGKRGGGCYRFDLPEP